MRAALAAAALAALLAIGVVVAFAAPGAVGRAASPRGGAAAAVYCPPGERQRRTDDVKILNGQVSVQTKRSKAFAGQQAKARAVYFKGHRKPKDRNAFVKKQQAQAKVLQKQLAGRQAQLRAAKAKLAACE